MSVFDSVFRFLLRPKDVAIAEKSAGIETSAIARSTEVKEPTVARSTDVAASTKVERPAEFKGNILDTRQQTAYARQLESHIGDRASMTEWLNLQSTARTKFTQIEADLVEAFYAGRAARMSHEVLKAFTERLGRQGIKNPEVDSALSRATENYGAVRYDVNDLEFRWRANGGS